MEYDVVESDSLEDLIRDVNELIADGWAPIGGVSVLRYEYDHRGDTEVARSYYQSMTKDTPRGKA